MGWAFGGTLGDEGQIPGAKAGAMLGLSRVVTAAWIWGEGLSLPSDRKDEGQQSRWGARLHSALGHLGPRLGTGGGREPGGGSWTPTCRAAYQDQDPCVGSSSGLEPGLPWPQSRTGAQRAPNPGDVKLAAGKSSIRASPLLWASPPHLLGCQAVKTSSPGALSGFWGTSRLPPPSGREAAPETLQ